MSVSAVLVGLLVGTGLQGELDAILDVAATRGAVVGACVFTPDGKTAYTRNPDLRLVPASNQKLLSCAFALDTLGPDWKPQTRFWRERDRIVIDSPGDPTLTLAQLEPVVKRLGRRPLVELRQAYRPIYPPSWEYDDLPNRYAAPISALTLDKGAFEVWASKGTVEPIPAAYGIHLVRRADRFAGEPVVSYHPFSARLIVRGLLPQARTRLETLAIGKPAERVGLLFGAKVRDTNSVPARPPDAVIEGPALRAVVAECLTDSVNSYAENLLLLASRSKGPMSPTDPYPVATRALREHLMTALGVSEDDLRPDDGSGLSRHNFVTPRTLCRLLQWSKTRPWWPDYEAGMVRGSKGTLSERLAGSSFVGKTGTLDAVVTLSGFVTGPDGRMWTFSVMLNHGIASNAEQRAVVDGFARRLETWPLPNLNN